MRGKGVIGLGSGRPDCNELNFSLEENIKEYVDKHPEVIGQVFIQWALCAPNLSFEVLSFIVTRFPGCIDTVEKCPEIKLMAWNSTPNKLLSVLDYLETTSPGFIRRFRDEESLPLLNAILRFNNVSADLVVFLILKAPEMTSYVIPDSEKTHGTIDFLPLHIACIHQNEDIIRLLIDAYPDAMYTRSGTSEEDPPMLPLHIACENLNVSAIRVLLERAPETVAKVVPNSDSLNNIHMKLPIDIVTAQKVRLSSQLCTFTLDDHSMAMTLIRDAMSKVDMNAHRNDEKDNHSFEEYLQFYS